MDIYRVKNIISSLAEGVDPVTGEIFPPESPYQNQEVIRALYTALKLIETADEKPSVTKLLPDNAGAPWTPEQETLLLTVFNSGASIKETAAQLGRTRNAITSRLKVLGVLPK